MPLNYTNLTINPSDNTERSVLDAPLQPCSEPGMPTTGYTRDGVCSMHRGDTGSHHICLKDVKEGDFCAATGQNWCFNKDNWCVCEWAFERAVQRLGCDAFELKCDATNQLALDHYHNTGAAADCIRRQCGSKLM